MSTRYDPKSGRRIRSAVVLTTILSIAALSGGCAQAGVLGDILGEILTPGGQDRVVVEILGVDSRARVIQVRTEDNRRGDVRYDDRTRVVYQQREYSVAALERGDVVEMSLQETSGGELYTDHIEVVRSAQDRTGDTGQRTTIEGVVEAVDASAGWFDMRLTTGAAVRVQLPYNPPRAEVDRFQRLRRGDRVRVEGTYLSQQRFELYRFR